MSALEDMMNSEIERLTARAEAAEARMEALQNRLAWIEAKANDAHPSEFGIVLAQIAGEAAGRVAR